MKICPSCREEFLDHIESCEGCHEKLVSEDEALLTPSKNAVLSKSELLEGETLPFLEGGLSHCREIEKILDRALISCVVYPVSLKGESNAATLGATSDMKYVILIRPSDLEPAKKALEGSFLDQVAKEGQGEVVVTAVDLEEDTITCPACGEVGALNDGECQSCGLFLGVFDQTQEN